MGSLRHRIDTTHTHLKEAIIDPDLAPPGPASFGTQISLLGPFRVNWDDAGITVQPGFPVADLDAGQVVVTAWVELADWWNGDDIGNGTTIEILVGGADWESSNTWPVVEVQAHENSASSIADANIAPSGVPSDFPNGAVKPQRAKTAGKVLVKVNLPGNTSAGAADVYAIVATPVA